MKSEISVISYGIGRSSDGVTSRIMLGAWRALERMARRRIIKPRENILEAPTYRYHKTVNKSNKALEN